MNKMDKVKSKINQKGWCSGETKCKEGVSVTVMCVNKTHGGDNSSVFWDVDSWYCIPEIDIINANDKIGSNKCKEAIEITVFLI